MGLGIAVGVEREWGRGNTGLCSPCHLLFILDNIFYVYTIDPNSYPEEKGLTSTTPALQLQTMGRTVVMKSGSSCSEQG